MKITAKKAYWLLLTAAVLLCCSGMMLGESYGSMASADAWQTRLPTAAVAVSSDYLVQGGQRVLLKPLTAERTIRVSLKTNHSQMNGSLSCTASPENAVTVQAEQTLTATQAGIDAELVLTPGDVTEETRVTITVRWTAESGQILQADFLTTVAPETAEQTGHAQAQVDATMSVGTEVVSGAAIPVVLSYGTDTQQILLSLAEGAEFPANTSYRIGYGEETTVLYDPMQILLQPGTEKEAVVLVTLPASTLETTQSITLQARVTTSAGEAILTGQTTSLPASVLLQEDIFYVLTVGESCVLELPAGWNGCSLSYTVERLTQTESGIAYQTATGTGSQGLSVTGDANGITIGVTDNGLQAGTYRLTLVWSYQTYTVARQNVTFYVGYPDNAVTGGNAK